MTPLRVAAVAGAFGRDVEAGLAKIERLVAEARRRGVRLLVLPEAAVGGYLADLDGGAGLPPAFALDSALIRRLGAIAGDIVLCVGFCESRGGQRFNSAVCLNGDGVLGCYRKVHQTLREDASYAAGSEFPVFDTPVGRLGMLICYDKAFPEAARALSLDGAQIIVCMSAWPTSRTGAAANLADDRWTKRFNLFDAARALENQVVLASANQAGSFGTLRFVANAKVVGPGGDVLATTGVHAGAATVDVDVPSELAQARRFMCHLADRRPDTYYPPHSMLSVS